jgi:hypothetical protein
MSKDDTKRRASRAKALMQSDAFVDVMKDLRDRQIAAFVNSGADQLDAREDAHAMVRALNKIEEALQADVDAGTLLDKQKERDRG